MMYKLIHFYLKNLFIYLFIFYFLNLIYSSDFLNAGIGFHCLHGRSRQSEQWATAAAAEPGRRMVRTGRIATAPPLDGQKLRRLHIKNGFRAGHVLRTVVWSLQIHEK